jgi:hypothetical protein
MRGEVLRDALEDPVRRPGRAAIADGLRNERTYGTDQKRVPNRKQPRHRYGLPGKDVQGIWIDVQMDGVCAFRPDHGFSRTCGTDVNRVRRSTETHDFSRTESLA